MKEIRVFILSSGVLLTEQVILRLEFELVNNDVAFNTLGIIPRNYNCYKNLLERSQYELNPYARSRS